MPGSWSLASNCMHLFRCAKYGIWSVLITCDVTITCSWMAPRLPCSHGCNVANKYKCHAGPGPPFIGKDSVYIDLWLRQVYKANSYLISKTAWLCWLSTKSDRLPLKINSHPTKICMHFPAALLEQWAIHNYKPTYILSMPLQEIPWMVSVGQTDFY